MSRTGSFLALAIGALLAGGADAAMTINPRGTGQVLLFPYYTVQGGQSTMFGIVNTTDRAKALVVSFRESVNARRALELTVLVGPHDTWTASVFAAADGGPANLLSDDLSCTIPRIADLPGAAQLPDDRYFAPFSDAAFSGANADGGQPAGPARTREGSIEVVELGELETGSAFAAAVTSVGTAPPSCAGVASADLAAALDAPGGGVYGNFSIVAAARGTILGGAATAIDGYSVVPVLGARERPTQWLNRGRTSLASTAVEAQVPIDGRTVTLRYPAERAIDAVSALLMTAELHGEFLDDPAAGAQMDWVVSSPTRRYYVDTQIAGAQLAPFQRRFSAQVGVACGRNRPWFYDREQRNADVWVRLYATLPPSGIGTPITYGDSAGLCLATDVIALQEFDPQTSPGAGVLASRNAAPVWVPGQTAGSMRFDLAQAGSASLPLGILPAGVAGPALRGLPLIGFQAAKYTSGGAAAGVVANYTYAVPLRGRTACSNANGEIVACP